MIIAGHEFLIKHKLRVFYKGSFYKNFYAQKGGKIRITLELSSGSPATASQNFAHNFFFQTSAMVFPEFFKYQVVFQDQSECYTREDEIIDTIEFFVS